MASLEIVLLTIFPSVSLYFFVRPYGMAACVDFHGFNTLGIDSRFITPQDKECKGSIFPLYTQVSFASSSVCVDDFHSSDGMNMLYHPLLIAHKERLDIPSYFKSLVLLST